METIIHKPRACGKTHDLVTEAIRNDGILIVFGEQEKQRIEREYPPMEGKVFSSDEVQSRLKGTGWTSPVYIDNADILLQRWIGSFQIRGISVNKGGGLMAYFSNGTEGLMYQEAYCFKCLHWDEEKGCPIWNLHEMFVSDSCKNETIATILNTLIPRREKPPGFADKCSMFMVDSKDDKTINWLDGEKKKK